jgi:hypothetical protein
MQSDMVFVSRNRMFGLAAALSVFAAAPVLAQQPSPWLLPNFSDCLQVQVSNPSDRPVDELASISVPEARHTALQFPGTLAIVIVPGARIAFLPSESVDMDDDGVPDEFVFPVKLKAHEKITADIYYSTTLHRKLPWPREVSASHSYGYNRATASLESRKIGYRTYGGFFLDVQARAKGKPGLNNSLVGFLNASESANSDTGRDVFHIGDTLGLGGLFLRSGKDVYRPPLNTPDYAHKPPPPETPTYRVLSSGPLRAVIEAHMDRWTIGNDAVSIDATYTIDAGAEAVECRFRILPISLSRTYEVGAGIRRLPKMRTDLAPGRLAIEGEQNPKIGRIGLAMYFDPATVSSTGTLQTKDGNNDVAIFRDRLTPGHAVNGHYWLAADWSGSGIQNLLGHLEKVEQQTRASAVVGHYRHSTTPEPRRLQGEAY